MEFLEKTATYREVGFMAANRVGKTSAAAFAARCWLTGVYPPWWKGRRFKTPISMWGCGTTNEKLKEIIQGKMFGTVIDTASGRKGFDGTGMIPRPWLGKCSWRQGINDTAETVKVMHVPTGKFSGFTQKSYEQGRTNYEGTFQHVIWLDEEPPEDVFIECLLRTTATTGRYEDNGLIMLTFTPLEGVSDVVKGFMPGDK